MNTDPIADMLTRLRNATRVGIVTVRMPASKVKFAISKILVNEGLILSCEIEASSPQDTLKIEMKYDEDGPPALTQLKRISKPGLRVYSKAPDIPLVMGGVATVIVSTSQGLMTGRAAYRKHLGGEVICYAW